MKTGRVGKPVPNLGPLEARVMDVVWTRGPLTVRDVADELEPVTDSAYTTVMTLMARLADKGLLSRKSRGRAYVYAPRLSRAEYEEQFTRSRMRSLIHEFGDVAIVQFAEELREVDPDRAHRLAEMLREKRR